MLFHDWPAVIMRAIPALRSAFAGISGRTLGKIARVC
jgi:hypothetical protein